LPLLTRFAQRQKDWVAAEAGRSKDQYQAEMPPLENGDHLVATLFRIGPTMVDGMGSSPITQAEICFWKCNTGARLSGWEAEALHRLSVEYLSESHAAIKRDAPAPWGGEVERPAWMDLRDRMRVIAAL